jgi:hypothetical protein
MSVCDGRDFLLLPRFVGATQQPRAAEAASMKDLLRSSFSMYAIGQQFQLFSELKVFMR